MGKKKIKVRKKTLVHNKSTKHKRGKRRRGTEYACNKHKHWNQVGFQMTITWTAGKPAGQDGFLLFPVRHAREKGMCKHEHTSVIICMAAILHSSNT